MLFKRVDIFHGHKGGFYSKAGRLQEPGSLLLRRSLQEADDDTCTRNQSTRNAAHFSHSLQGIGYPQRAIRADIQPAHGAEEFGDRLQTPFFIQQEERDRGASSNDYARICAMGSKSERLWSLCCG